MCDWVILEESDNLLRTCARYGSPFEDTDISLCGQHTGMMRRQRQWILENPDACTEWFFRTESDEKKIAHLEWELDLLVRAFKEMGHDYRNPEQRRSDALFAVMERLKPPSPPHERPPPKLTIVPDPKE